MTDQKDDPPIKRAPLKDLHIEPEAEALLESAAMEPYMDLAIAVMGGKDTGPAIEKLAELPLEERYVWRVASALKWAFADLETLSIEADRKNDFYRRPNAARRTSATPAASVLLVFERLVRGETDGDTDGVSHSEREGGWGSDIVGI